MAETAASPVNYLRTRGSKEVGREGEGLGYYSRPLSLREACGEDWLYSLSSGIDTRAKTGSTSQIYRELNKSLYKDFKEGLSPPLTFSELQSGISTQDLTVLTKLLTPRVQCTTAMVFTEMGSPRPKGCKHGKQYPLKLMEDGCEGLKMHQ